MPTLTLINAFEVPSDKEDEFLLGWEMLATTCRPSPATSIRRSTKPSRPTPTSAS